MHRAPASGSRSALAVPRAPGDQVIITVASVGPWPLLTARYQQHPEKSGRWNTCLPAGLRAQLAKQQGAEWGEQEEDKTGMAWTGRWRR